MATPLEPDAVLWDDEIRPYRIHVPSKYVDRTRRKLELTRLPQETLGPTPRDWWEPKAQIGPLLDFWLEKYDWRAQETVFNDQLPQFRTAVTVPGSEFLVQLHFLHARSPHEHAVPLLLVPPFPFANLSLGHLIRPLTEPEDPDAQQPFHVVIPSLPGLGFSDDLPSNTPAIPATANILDLVMSRLSYKHYLVSNTSSAASSLAGIDWKLANHLATYHSGSCLGAHFINPLLSAPTLKEAPLEWAKWSVAKLFRAPFFGYQSEDFRALGWAEPALGQSARPTSGPAFVIHPNALSYALCDSPVGMLALVLKITHILDAQKDFSETDIINFAQIAWFPGPEAVMRLWARCLAHREEQPLPRPGTKPDVAITVFSGSARDADIETQSTSPRAAPVPYACPAWANVSYNAVHVRRVAGSPGLVAWDRPELIGEGVRGLARRLLSSPGGGRLRSSKQPGTAPLQEVVVVVPPNPAPGRESEPQQQPQSPPAKPPTAKGEAPWGLERIRESSETPSKARPEDGARAAPNADFDGASPDTIVVTPPLSEGLR
ncbi:epoxide hydrolase [Colletotrichum falcatum]|nr:epoxide hydrolase [Colletotrichum falcatum]